MKEPVWLERPFLLAVHERLLAEFGGKDGVRDENRLDSALERPRQAYAYGDCSLFRLAASYATAIVQGHPFVDGNKRTAFVAAVTFLEINRMSFSATEADTVLHTLGLAASEISEADYACWLQTASKKTT